MKNAILLFILSLLVFSCRGPEGPMGPPGSTGRDGADGNANVFTEYLEISPSMWTTDVSKNIIGIEMEVNRISDYIAERGAVNVFYLTFDYGTTAEYFALPFTYRSNDGQLVTETYGFGPEYVKIEIQGHDSLPDMPTQDYIYKVVIIEE